MREICDTELHEFPQWYGGGSWTEQKLDAFTKYVRAYLTIFESRNYLHTIYFDGFAGSGSRKDPKTELYNQLKLTPEEEEGYKGAAERVVALPQSFDFYYFIDNQECLDKLEPRLKALSGAEKKKLIFRPGDCNQWLKMLGDFLRSNDDHAALIFLDPFGMQILWESIEQLKDSRSDVWILIPTGVIVNRLLDSAGMLRHSALLESFFGLSEQEIRNEFYRMEKQTTLFGEDEITRKVRNPIQHIANLYIRQLKTVWKFVTEPPLVLRNSRNVPIYHFVLASNNETAHKIAGQIIRSI